MANYATLKSTIEDNIKQNGAGAITGPVLQSALLAMVNSLGAEFQFGGVAEPTDNPGTPDYKVAYLASTPGTYVNFGGIVVNAGEVAVLKYDTAWSKGITDIAANYSIAKVTGNKFLVLNDMTLSVDPNAGYFVPVHTPDYTTLVIGYDGKSKYLYVPGLAVSTNTVTWLLRDFVFDIANWIAFRRWTQAPYDFTTIADLHYICVTFKKSENPTFDPNTARAVWSSDYSDYVTAGAARTELEAVIAHGEYWYNGVKRTTLAVMDTYTYSVDPLKKYAVRGFGVPSALYTTVQFIHFFTGSLWLGYLCPVAAGPYVQEDFYYVLEVPMNCDKIVVNTHKDYTVELYELPASDPVFSADLRARIENLERPQGVAKMNTITIRGQYIYARTALNGTQDIIVAYLLWQNNNYTWDRTYIGLRTQTLDEILNTTPVHIMGDSTGALAIMNDAPWHLWAQHGYCIPYVVATHPLDSSDIGATWKDQLDRAYTIGNISGENIYLLPVISPTAYPGVYTRSWKSPESVNNPEITSLVHVSGGTHTGNITPDSWATTQLRPMMVLKRRTFLADGAEISGDGTYYCDEFVISEVLNCTNPWTVETWWPVTQEDIGAEYTQNFTICGLGHRFDVILNMKKPYLFAWYGANQVQHLVPTGAMPGYDVYGIMPRVRNYDTPYLINDLSRASENAYNNLTSLYDTSKQPDRYISYFDNSGDRPLGCASGVSIARGVSKDANRPSLSVAGDLLLNLSPVNRNKAYFRLIHPSKFENRILPASFICNISTYLCYFDPNANDGEVYWYKDGNAWMVYAHFQSANDKVAVVVPAQMDGLSINVVDKTDGVTLHTEIVDGGVIYVSADASNNNYIVLRIS